jgi:hypothetical protein
VPVKGSVIQHRKGHEEQMIHIMNQAIVNENGKNKINAHVYENRKYRGTDIDYVQYTKGEQGIQHNLKIKVNLGN